jgi:ABC-type glutathione transport system ATPase component
MNSISEEYGVDQAATGSAQSEPVVSVHGLVKRYGRHEAVGGIDLEVRRGEIFAFLGPNGAGKPVTKLRRSLQRGKRTVTHPVRGHFPDAPAVLGILRLAEVRDAPLT